MKYLALIPLVLVASCASRPQLVVRPLPPPAVEPIESVRYGEVVRAYHIGRYVDPNHPQTMHEHHPVYRVEASARWNLHPGAVPAANMLNPPPDAAFVPPATNDAIFAEMNRQREATQRILSEAARLAASYAEIQSLVAEMKGVARDQVLVRTRLVEAEQRVARFEKDLQNLTAQPTPRTNDAPFFTPESPEKPAP